MEQQEKVSLLRKILIIFFSVLGFLTTIKLAIIYIESNFDPYALPSFCSINNFIDCDGVAKTIHSQFFGIPLAFWGMFLYLFIVFMIFVDKLKSIKYLNFLEVFKSPYAYIAALGYISFFISMILAGVSLFEIKKVCVLCVFTYFLNLFIAISATSSKSDIIECFKTSFFDLIAALKIKKYLVAFIIACFMATSFLTYTSMSYCFTPQVKRFKSISEFAKMKNNPYKTSGNILGDKDSKLVVEVYSDYNCPICYAENLMIFRIANELSNVKVVYYNLPLDMECNNKLRTQFHEGSCSLARYAIASEKQDKFLEFHSELFEKQPKGEKEILKLAKALGINPKQLKEDANSFETNTRLYQDIEKADNLGIEGTPTVIINGKVYSGVKPYYELKEILIKAGANERK